jgi:hypothetical protein
MYDNTTGEIVKRGTTSRDTLPAVTGFTLVEGVLTNENYVVDGVPVYIAPPPPTPEELAAEEAREFMRRYQISAVSVLYEIDKRLRVLEGAPAITLDQFKQGLKTFLGL